MKKYEVVVYFKKNKKDKFQNDYRLEYYKGDVFVKDDRFTCTATAFTKFIRYKKDLIEKVIIIGSVKPKESKSKFEAFMYEYTDVKFEIRKSRKGLSWN